MKGLDVRVLLLIPSVSRLSLSAADGKAKVLLSLWVCSCNSNLFGIVGILSKDVGMQVVRKKNAHFNIIRRRTNNKKV
ncbi:uncharacterized protein LY79DRAFT_534989 [Colletotrichum navitas]|uniref:Uncharacterized protein n=1 Tax=Colletotrichum navitas TaxID=681940 RepID=A0AAD8QB94_9PEZI|nr:uncharacterized protein LY79DRAFT_534989 [Colletotrichum navitas]KAK1599415.1 hypothetical protein LY79DRAFT_534989 [Colletotrichum navitas]